MLPDRVPLRRDLDHGRQEGHGVLEELPGRLVRVDGAVDAIEVPRQFVHQTNTDDVTTWTEATGLHQL